ncbi:MAG: glycosyltransferase family 2 protein [Parvularculaceae bacterium]|nr:glycosyltransferase family 2 protein [Parvularculaceae bacterium]
MARVSVIVVNYNSGDRLARCIACLELQTFRDFEIIIVDNASTDGSLSAEAITTPRLRVISSNENLGFAAANNLAVRDATGDWIAFLNPDAYAERDWLSALMSAVERYPWADAFGSTQLMASDPDVLDGAGDVFHILGVGYRGGFGQSAANLPEDGECFAPCAAAALYRRDVFTALGGFDERFFCYGEDVDLGFRLRLRGGRCIQVNRARVLHEGSGISGRYSTFTIYHGNRNRIWLTYKNVPDFLYWGLFPLRLAFDLYLYARSFSIGAGKAYRRAMIDGYAGLSAFRNDRRKIQAARRLSYAEFAKLAAWSPLALTGREIRLAPIGTEKSA